MAEMTPPAPMPEALDPVLLSVLSNRLDGIVREMSNTLLKAARSAVIAVARDSPAPSAPPITSSSPPPRACPSTSSARTCRPAP